jgi:hypothetical protein
VLLPFSLFPDVVVVVVVVVAVPRGPTRIPAKFSGTISGNYDSAETAAE